MKTQDLNQIGKVYSWLAIFIGVLLIAFGYDDIYENLGMMLAYTVFLFHLYDGKDRWYTFIQTFAILKILFVFGDLTSIFDVLDLAGLGVIFWHAMNKQRGIK